MWLGLMDGIAHVEWPSPVSRFGEESGVTGFVESLARHEGSLYAATSPDARGGDYIGPDGFMENWGHPRKTRSTARSYDRAVATRLWEVTEQLTSVRYPLPPPRG